MIEPAYLAGLFDGEGTVQIQWSAGRSVNSLIVALEITNTYREVLDRIQRVYGGRIYSVNRSQKRSSLMAHRIRFTGSEAEFVARSILPHSIIKAEQLAIFLEARSCLRPYGGRQAKLSEEERSQRNDLITRLQGSRQNGVVTYQ